MTKSVRDHVDWVAVDRAWDGQPVGRRLTYAEKVHLVWHKVQEGPWSAQSIGELCGMRCGDDRARAAKLAEDVASGRVKPIPRNWLGTPATT